VLRNLLAPILASPRLFGGAVLHATTMRANPSDPPVRFTRRLRHSAE